MGDIQSRKWQITINNPAEKGYTHENIKQALAKFKSCVYWCMSDEVGGLTQTQHTHVYMACSSAVRFSTLFRQFAGAHFEVAKGTSEQNRDYVFKDGKWATSNKSETNLKETHEEWGTMPVERQGKRNDIDDLYDMIKQGLSDYEILETSPEYMLQLDKIEKVRQTINQERYKKEWRDLRVTYIYGLTGTGKTRSVMEQYGYENVYRVMDYEHPFDSYRGQDVICFDEYHSNFRMCEFLQLLDGYPIELKCRYNNKYACYHHVYIISNMALYDQYTNLQRSDYRTWCAFLRRINEVQIFKEDGEHYRADVRGYIDGFFPAYAKDVPFK